MNEATVIDGRQQRGLELAAIAKITKREDGKWVVPSQSGNGRYVVEPNRHCTCPDHETRACRCKHMIAVELVMKRELHEDGTEIVTKSVTITQSVTRPTYAQNWSAYNEAQTNEKAQFQSLLFDLCRDLPTPTGGKGRPRLPLSDAVFSAVFKVYSTVSARRFTSDLCDAQTKGYISKVPHFNSIFNYLEMPEMTDVLVSLIERSSLPMRAIESDFAVDSTGFTTSRFVRWYDHKYNAIRQEHDWVKTHLMCGVKTNIVTAVEILDRDASDTKQLPALVETTAKNFTMREVSADKGYSSIKNHDAIAKHGATPFISFKANATGTDRGRSSMWTKMFHFFSYQQETFLAHYHKRSNVESTVMMIKTKFGDSVRSKTDTAMKNEVLAKVLCHNICCLIMAACELGIDINL